MSASYARPACGVGLVGPTSSEPCLALSTLLAAFLLPCRMSPNQMFTEGALRLRNSLKLFDHSVGEEYIVSVSEDVTEGIMNPEPLSKS